MCLKSIVLDNAIKLYYDELYKLNLCNNNVVNKIFLKARVRYYDEYFRKYKMKYECAMCNKLGSAFIMNVVVSQQIYCNTCFKKEVKDMYYEESLNLIKKDKFYSYLFLEKENTKRKTKRKSGDWVIVGEYCNQCDEITQHHHQYIINCN